MNDIDNDIIRISEELDVPLKKLYMLSNNRIRYHKRNQKKCYSNYRKVIIHRGRGHKNRVLKVPNEYLSSFKEGYLKGIFTRCPYLSMPLHIAKTLRF